MTERSDADLLASWSAEGSEKAFAELARRYGGLIYHASLRRTGRSDLAQEASQNALLILARKAQGLGDVPSLAGWLHRTVCYEVSKLLRRERRHDARMKELPAPDNQDPGDHAWQEAAPLLDQALDSLPVKDREIIFQRYFEGLSFEEIAQRGGGNSAALRQRSSRAMEKLRVALTKRGAAMSGTSLASALGTTLSQAAPAPVLAKLAASPTAGAAALSWGTLTSHSLHLMKLHPATWIVAALVLSALPLGLQAYTNSAARGRITSLESSLSGAAPTTSGRAPGERTAVASRSAKPSLLRLAELVAEGGNGSRIANAEAKRLIKRMSAGELEELLRESIAVELPPKKRLDLIDSLFREYAFYRKDEEVPTESILAMSALLSDHLDAKGQEQVWSWAAVRATRWAKDNPTKAMAWYEEQVKAGRLDSSRLNLSVPGGIFTGLRQASPEAADTFYASLTEDARMSVIYHFQRSGQPEDFLDLAAKFEDPAKRQGSLIMMFRYGTKDKSAAEVRGWIDRSGTRDEDACAELFALAAEGDPYREDGGVRYHEGMKTDQIAERIAWLKDPATGGESSKAIGIFLANTMKSAPNETHEALTAEWEKNPDQEMLCSYMRRAGSSVPGVLDALDRYPLLDEGEARDEILRQLLATPAGKEVLADMHKHGISDADLREAQLPPELFR